MSLGVNAQNTVHLKSKRQRVALIVGYTDQQIFGKNSEHLGHRAFKPELLPYQKPYLFLGQTT